MLTLKKDVKSEHETSPSMYDSAKPCGKVRGSPIIPHHLVRCATYHIREKQHASPKDILVNRQHNLGDTVDGLFLFLDNMLLPIHLPAAIHIHNNELAYLNA